MITLMVGGAHEPLKYITIYACWSLKLAVCVNDWLTKKSIKPMHL